jgi:hypothetical protein
LLVELEGHAPERRVVRIKPGEETVLELSLRRGSGQLEVVSSEPGAELYVDGQRTARLPAGTLQLAPGRHRLEVRKPGFASWRRQVSVTAGETVRVDVELRAVVRRRSLRPYAWATLAVSGVALAAGGAFYGLARQRISSLEGARGEFGPVYRDLEQEGRTYGRVAIAGLAVGGALALGAGALFLLEPRERAERRARPPLAGGRSWLGRLRRSLTAVPLVSPSGLGAQATLRWP